MKALILAAGMGKRLFPYTKDTPKCLLKVLGKELIEFQLGALNSHGINDIIVVTGHLADKVKSKVGNRGECIFNPFYDKRGILFSLQAAKDRFYGKEFVFLASDIVFHPNILDLILDVKGDIVAGVERKDCNGEDTKALIKDGIIIKTGKTLQPIQNSEIVELVHIHKFGPKGSKVLFDNVERIIESGKVHASMVDAINLTIKEGIKIIPVYCNGLRRIEIDFNKDLVEARKVKWF